MAGFTYLFDVLALLLAAVLVVPLFQRFGIPAVLGYLAAGVALGPYTPGPVVDIETARPVAELGVVFLLFAVGLDLPLKRLKTLRRYIFGLGLLQVAVTAVIFGGIALALGLAPEIAIVVGTTLAFSSTATVLSILVERNEAITGHGRIAISVLIFQDLAVVPILALLPLLASESHAISGAVGLAAAKAALALAAIYFIGRFITRPVYRYVAAIRNPEMFLAASLLLVLTVAIVTAAAGMSMALGALLGGILVADSAYRHQVEADIEPFRGLLVGLFFVTVGMSIDLPLVAANALTVVSLTVGCLAIKALVIMGLFHALRLGRAQGIRLGLLLAQVGEFAFIVFGEAMTLRILDQKDGQTLIAAVALSMVLTPLLAIASRRLSGSIQKKMGKVAAPSDMEHLRDHVVIAGFGRVGRTIAEILGEHSVPYVALDLDLETVVRAREGGFSVFYGDASQSGVLRAVGIERARAAVVTVNRPSSAERAVTSVRAAAPQLPIIARSHDVPQLRVLGRAGATAVVPETIEASLQMAGLVLRSVGVPAEIVDRSIQSHRTPDNGDDH